MLVLLLFKQVAALEHDSGADALQERVLTDLKASRDAFREAAESAAALLTLEKEESERLRSQLDEAPTTLVLLAPSVNPD